MPQKTWWTFRIFLFFLLGEGGGGGVRGSPRGREGGFRFFFENPRKGGGGVSLGGGGAEGQGGGGLNMFFRGRNIHQDKHSGALSPHTRSLEKRTFPISLYRHVSRS